MKTNLGPLEMKIIGYAQMCKLKMVTIGELVIPLGVTTKQVGESLSRMARAGVIARIRPGLYLVPEKLPPGGLWAPSEYAALDAFMRDKGARYQICGPNAFNQWGFDNQIPNRLYAYNNCISGERNVGTYSMTLIKVPSSRLGGTTVFKTPEGIKVIYSSDARTLMDAVYDWSRFDGIPRAYRWILEAIKKNRTLTPALVQMTLRFGNKGTIRRIGFLLEQAGVAPVLLTKLSKAIGALESMMVWFPGRPRKGAINKKWGLIVNGEVSDANI